MRRASRGGSKRRRKATLSTSLPSVLPPPAPCLLTDPTRSIERTAPKKYWDQLKFDFEFGQKVRSRFPSRFALPELTISFAAPHQRLARLHYRYRLSQLHPPPPRHDRFRQGPHRHDEQRRRGLSRRGCLRCGVQDSRVPLPDACVQRGGRVARGAVEGKWGQDLLECAVLSPLLLPPADVLSPW